MTTPMYDVVVIGAGIHGVGVAQAAAAAGYRTLVLEQSAVAFGTSSRSSKLIHGGLRYLETFHWRLVRESLAERTVLLRNAPDLVRLVPFHIPVYATTSRPPWMIRAGLSLYAVLGELARANRFATLPRRRWGELDGLVTDNLRAVFRYRDAQTDDTELTRAVMRSAQALGAELACPACFLGAERCTGGYTVRYTHAGREQVCETRALVNAAGPWANAVLACLAPKPEALAMELVQGTHIILEGRLTRGVYYVEAPRDRRAVFVMPWGSRILVGTTETPYRGDPAAVQPLPREIEYLATTFRRYFPTRSANVVDGFAGLRVLPHREGGYFRRTRETILHEDARRAAGVVTVYGGKLTTYRVTAEKVLVRLRPQLPARKARADTASLRLERLN